MYYQNQFVVAFELPIVAKTIKLFEHFLKLFIFSRIFEIIIMVTYDRIFHILISNNKIEIKSENVGGNDGVWRWWQ